MDNVGPQTKKVNTYGRKKTQIINVHNDFTPQRPTRHPLEDDSPSPIKSRTRPPLSTKLSQDIIASKLNMASKQKPDGKGDKAEKGKDKEVAKPSRPKRTIPTRQATPVKSFRPPRAARCRQVTPVSREKAATNAKEKQPRQVMDWVELVKRPTRKADVDDLSSKLDKVTIKDKEEGKEQQNEKEEKEKTPAPDNKEKEAKADKPTTAPKKKASTALTPDVKALLKVCSSPKVQSFTEFLSSALLLDLIPSRADTPVLRKIGEASYSEVFAIARGSREVVLKVIPLFSDASLEVAETEEAVPDCSEALDVRREVEITSSMSELEGGGFIEFKGAFVVQGEYPDALLDEWDAYRSKHGTESARPGVFTEAQQYALIVLADGGIDLESFIFNKSSSWVQASGIFWQVVDALARAEEAAHFEHRDLHEGQILITTNATVHGTDFMRPSSTGVNATIIDFGLSRLDKPNGHVMFGPIDEEVFDGVGEQWDVYRAIRDQMGGDWSGYHPVSNVMWIKYILRYITRSKSLVKPRAGSEAPRASTSPFRRGRTPVMTRKTGTESPIDEEVQKSRNYKAWNILKEMESVLSEALSGRSPGRRGVKSAQDVWQYGRDKGWVASV